MLHAVFSMESSDLLERIQGLEPCSSAWKAEARPIYHTRLLSYESLLPDVDCVLETVPVVTIFPIVTSILAEGDPVPPAFQVFVKSGAATAVMDVP